MFVFMLKIKLPKSNNLYFVIIIITLNLEMNC